MSCQITFSQLAKLITEYKGNQDSINYFANIIEKECFRPYNKYNPSSRGRKPTTFNRGNSGGGYKRGNSRNAYSSNNNTGSQKSRSSVIRKLINNSDKMINEFNKCINKLTGSNYDIIYKDVVNLFTNYITNIIVEYVESFIKFGIQGQHNIEDLNMTLINEKYLYYQEELWKILINKTILTNNTLYFKFILHLCKLETNDFNIKLIENIKNVFKTYCHYNYDTIQLGDIDDEDPVQFFQSVITELEPKETKIYNKIGEIIDIFKDYKFDLSVIINNEININESLCVYLAEGEIIKQQETFINYIKNLFQRDTSKGSVLGNILSIHLLSNTHLKQNIMGILENIASGKISLNDEKGYILLGIFELKETINSVFTAEDIIDIKNHLSVISKRLPSIIKYKMLDVLDILVI